MGLVISRHQNHYDGMSIQLEDNGHYKNICVINGNQVKHQGPVAVLSIDAHVIYGLSQLPVISRITENGPQQLLTIKEYAHTMFEHGMKAALGKIKIKNNVYNTSLETFYKLESKIEIEGVVLSILTHFNKPFLSVCLNGFKPILISSGNEIPYEEGYNVVYLDQIRDIVSINS